MLALIFWAGERICRRADGEVRFLVNVVGEVEARRVKRHGPGTPGEPGCVSSAD
jgi:hypothetical protein